jgi:hypothetical protein
MREEVATASAVSRVTVPLGRVCRLMGADRVTASVARDRPRVLKRFIVGILMGRFCCGRGYLLLGDRNLFTGRWIAG